MFKRVRVVAVTATLLVASTTTLGGVAGGASAASAPYTERARVEASVEARAAAVKRGATVATSAKQVVEGDRYLVTATIKSPRQASKVTLQKYQPPSYTGDAAEWPVMKTVAVHGKQKVKFPAIAIDENAERYRVVVTYKQAKPFTSKPAGVTVWRWIPLKEYDAYYTTGGTIFGTTTIDGHPYIGWGPVSSSHTGAWEARFTPGRHCKSLKAVLGVADISSDGSSGSIAFTADAQPLYTSPTLTPGMSVPVTIPLANPYRFGIQLFDTTPDGTTGRDAIESWPVLGEPALLCTGV